MKFLHSDKKKGLTEIIIFLSAIAFICIKTVFSSGELSPDSIQYFLQAQNFWEYKVNFPLGYAFLLKIFSNFTGSLFIASKVISLLSYASIIIFSYRRKFFFTQTLILFSFYPFIGQFSSSLSEPFFFLLNFLILYSVYKTATDQFSWKYPIILFALFFLLTATRFSALFILVSVTAFFLYLFLKNKLTFLRFVLLTNASILGVILYLCINKLYCGSFLGARDHLLITQCSFFDFISGFLSSSAKDLSFLNGILHKILQQKINFFHIYTGVITFLSALIIVLKKRKSFKDFDIFLLFSFSIVFLGIGYSYYTTQIDNTVRIKSIAFFFLLFFVLINIPEQTLKIYAGISLLICLLNIFTVVKNSQNITVYIKKMEGIVDNYPSTIVFSDLKQQRSASPILLLKSMIIDKGLKFEESQSSKNTTEGNCIIKAEDVLK
ncbi:hypothetical protein ASG01_06415 [Chryseobacterium sp. Leaf180]|uniref:hypothetical protein n=1 Tax=Chryseobacterium sp. Leaf180 TaxID=1736289 RepID=UPI0006FBEEE7|nr:hypothetical protein [Chryseobacterium sp. Leaf180]KQR95473.1 hypothetical protein ASG01_06415 [Chryseobacterium sp. Leaf180]